MGIINSILGATTTTPTTGGALGSGAGLAGAQNTLSANYTANHGIGGVLQIHTPPYVQYTIDLQRLDNGLVVHIFDNASRVTPGDATVVRRFIVPEGESLGEAIQVALVEMKLAEGAK
jgi:hypothetical protein